MSVPSMEELVETFFDTADRTSPHASDRVMIRIGLLAVLEKHVGPIIEKAHIQGQIDDDNVTLNKPKANAYATRIIDQIKGA